MDPSLNSLAVMLREGGLVMGLLLALVGGFRRWWVFGHHYVEMTADRDHWRSLCLSGHDISKQAVSTLNQVVRP